MNPTSRHVLHCPRCVRKDGLTGRDCSQSTDCERVELNSGNTQAFGDNENSGERGGPPTPKINERGGPPTQRDNERGGPPTQRDDERGGPPTQKEGEKSENETSSHLQQTNNNNNGESEIDWKQFEIEPLKSIDLVELRKQRTTREVEFLARLLIKYKHLLSDGSLDFRTNPNVKHNTTATIRTTENNPKIVARGQKCNPEETKEFTKQISQKLKEGVIEPSYAPWCSNALIIRKDGKIRMVIDYRALNKVTIKDSYPMPRIQDVTDVLQGTKWFTGIDCVQAFHQIPMDDERSRDLTSFKGPIAAFLGIDTCRWG